MPLPPLMAKVGAAKREGVLPLLSVMLMRSGELLGVVRWEATAAALSPQTVQPRLVQIQ